MDERRWRLIFVSTVLLLALGLGMFGTGYRANAQGAVKLTLGSWDDENGNKRHLAVVADFKAQNPDIDVEILPNPAGSDWHTKVLTWIASGTLPDVYMADSSFVPLYVEAGGLVNLRPYIEGKDGFDPTKVFYDTVYKNGFYKGDPYVLAKDYSTVAVYANQALFDAAGVKLPKEGWTYDDLLSAAQQLTIDAKGNNATSPDFDPKNIKQYGMDHRSDWFRSFQTVIHSFGSATISDDGKTLAGYLDSKASIAALQWMKDAVHKYHVAPTTNFISSLPSGGVIPQFLDGKFAMVFGMGPWYLDTLAGKPGFKYAILPMPTGPGGHHGQVCWAGFGMAPTSKNKDAAWKLLKALGTEMGQKQYGQHALSSMPSIMADKTNDPFWATFINEVKYLDPLDDLKNPYYLECVGTPAGTQITAVLFGEEGANKDVKQLVDSVMPDLQKCLDTQGKSMPTPTPAK